VQQNLRDGLKGQSFLTLKDFSAEEIRLLLNQAKKFKENREEIKKSAPLSGKSLIMLFQKRSTRTRVSTELAMVELGGNPLFLGNEDIHLGVNESIRDTANVLGRMASGIIARVYNHEMLEQLKTFSNIPVINALSNKYHPLQALADIFTIESHFKNITAAKIAWVGDGNNVCHSLMIAASKLSIPLTVACPPPYQPLPEVSEYCKSLAHAELMITSDPKEAVSQANVIVTDTFISMGEENETESKLKSFQGYQVSSELTKLATSDYIFMHCLPRHQEEVTDEIFYGPHSVVFEEAENRFYTVAAVLMALL